MLHAHLLLQLPDFWPIFVSFEICFFYCIYLLIYFIIIIIIIIVIIIIIIIIIIASFLVFCLEKLAVLCLAASLQRVFRLLMEIYYHWWP